MAECGAMQVRGAQSHQADFKVEDLEAYLHGRMIALGGPLQIERAPGGMSNPTFFLRAGEWSAVLRKRPAISLSPSAHRIDREFTVLTALQDSAVPAPVPIVYCDSPDIVGTPFYIMERLNGRVFSDASLPGLSAEERRACYRAMAQTMAALHNFDWAAADLSRYGRVGGYFERQLAGWSQQWSSFNITDNPAIDELLAWLTPRVPNDDLTALCHGDFRFANLMFHPTEPRVIGIFDWELSTLGHPLADVGFNLQSWFLKPDENGGVAGLDLAALGIPSARDYLDDYYAAWNGDVPITRFHVAFAMFRAAVGVSGVAVREESGQVQQDNAPGQARKYAIAYAKAGLAAIESWPEQGDGR